MKKKRNLYLLNIAIVLLILTIIFIYKGIYPFGNNTLIWGDMHDQITAFYYNFYDALNHCLFCLEQVQELIFGVYYLIIY